MAKVGAQRAAELTGKSKSTIQRAMKSGKLSYELNDHEQRVIDVSELERVFGLVPQSNTSTVTNGNITVNATPSVTAEMEIQNARHTMETERLNLQIRLLNEQLDTAKEQIADLKGQRDQWQKQAQQVLLTSQQSQKQAEERITELRDREATRQRIIQQRNRQQQSAGQTAQAKTPSGGKEQQPQFRKIQANNQNRKSGGFRLSDFFRGKKSQTA